MSEYTLERLETALERCKVLLENPHKSPDAEKFIEECLKIALKYMDYLDDGSHGFPISEDLYLIRLFGAEGQKVKVEQRLHTSVRYLDISEIVNQYGGVGFAKLMCDTLEKFIERRDTIRREDIFIPEYLKNRLSAIKESMPIDPAKE